jgi:hypothetical protein
MEFHLNPQPSEGEWWGTFSRCLDSAKIHWAYGFGLVGGAGFRAGVVVRNQPREEFADRM